MRKLGSSGAHGLGAGAGIKKSPYFGVVRRTPLPQCKNTVLRAFGKPHTGSAYTPAGIGLAKRAGRGCLDWSESPRHLGAGFFLRNDSYTRS